MRITFIILLILTITTTVFALDVYKIETSYNDELFIINGEKYEAKTYCFNINEGDRVIFLEGSPSGACATATFKDLDTDVICECWCD